MIRIFSLACVISFAAPLLASAQQAAPASTPAALKLFASSADVAALIAKAKAERRPDQPLLGQRLVGFAPFVANLEYRAAVGPAAIHENDAEFFYVVEGAGTLVTGGKLVMETKPNPANRTGTAIEGGESQRVAKGDFIMVPPGVGHWFSTIDGTLVLMALHLPVMPAH